MRADFATLATRANFPGLALRLLGPVINTSSKRGANATPREMAEYSFALVRIGASHEALQLLKRIESSELPVSLLYQSYAHISHWDYAAAIPLLERYLRSETITDYQRAIGQTNLVGALVHENVPEAGRSLTLLESLTQRHAYDNLFQNALIFRAEWEVSQKQWATASTALDEASRRLKNPQSLEALFIEKWRAVVLLYRDGSPKSLTDLSTVRERAKSLRHWETVRNCDYHEAVATGDEKLFHRVYFGTPYESVRAHLLDVFKAKGNLPAFYDWEMGAGGKATPLTVLSPSVAEKMDMKAGQAPHRLLQILASDFYRPIRVAAVHHKLSPNEYYNPVTSPGKVHQVVKRLREWMERKKLPLTIEESEGAYRLCAESACVLRVPRERAAGSRSVTLLTLLKETANDSTFSAAEAAKLLKINLWAAIRLLKAAKTDGTIEVVGAGAKTRYRFPQGVQSPPRSDAA